MNGNGELLSSLMERYASGEDEVFEMLYREMAPRLYGFCRRLTRHQPEADDCFQETFLKIHRARATFVSGANALHWAFAVARSVCVSRARYWRRRPESLGDADDVASHAELNAHNPITPEDEVIAADLLDATNAELRSMSEKNRAAFVLMKEEGLTAKDAAAVLGTTSEVVRQRAHRAYLQIREPLVTSGALEELRA
jgi:RNA polymerase sigma-70 factor, ECF subfamily